MLPVSERVLFISPSMQLNQNHAIIKIIAWYIAGIYCVHILILSSADNLCK